MGRNRRTTSGSKNNAASSHTTETPTEREASQNVLCSSTNPLPCGVDIAGNPKKIASMSFRLFDLPDELVVSIIEPLQDDKGTLLCLALCSKRLQALAEPFLYQSIFVREVGEVADLLHALQQRTERQKAIQVLEARCRFGRLASSMLSNLWSIMRTCVNLKELIVESPYCNNGRWSDSEGWNAHMQQLFDALGLGIAALVPTPPREGPFHCLTKGTFS